MTESKKAQSLLSMLLRLERQTSKYCFPEDLAKLEAVLLKMEFPKCDLPENRFDPSMKRMLYVRHPDYDIISYILTRAANGIA